MVYAHGPRVLIRQEWGCGCGGKSRGNQHPRFVRLLLSWGSGGRAALLRGSAHWGPALLALLARLWLLPALERVALLSLRLLPGAHAELGVLGAALGLGRLVGLKIGIILGRILAGLGIVVERDADGATVVAVILADDLLRV